MPCCDDTPATYRCQATIPLDSYHPHYTSKGEIDSIDNMGDAKKKALFLLLSYWSCTVDGGQTNKWIACEKCVKESVIDYFTHKPGGWKEDQYVSIGSNVEYEEINTEIA